MILTDDNDYYNKCPVALKLRFYDTEVLDDAIDSLKNCLTENAIIFHENLEDLWDAFQRKYTAIMAAGGLVKISENKYLLIFRNGKWDIPKGKAEEGENIEQTAIREVEEECGIAGVKIIEKLPNTYHTYTIGEQKILKETHWFLMQYDGDETPKPQTEEGITEVRWVKKNEMKELLENSFSSIKELIQSSLF